MAVHSSPGIPGIPHPLLAPSTESGSGTSSPGGIIRAHWLRFTWGPLKAVPLVQGSFGEETLRMARREEAEEVLGVIQLALAMDSGWNDSLVAVQDYLRSTVARLFNAEDPLCLVVPKGNRLIAASLLDPAETASSHLVSGPSVLMEYRNRGIGGRLLQASLATLQERGLSEARAITRANTVAARFVYPKFGGVSEEVRFSPSEEASRQPKA